MNLRRAASMILLAALILLLAAGCSGPKPKHSQNNYNAYSAGVSGSGSAAEDTAAEPEQEEDSRPEEEPAPEIDPEELKNMVPYVGMPAEYIDMTICGPHTREETGLMLGVDSKFGYIWDVGEDGALRVETSGPEGTVTYVVRFDEELYWDADGLPHMTDRSDPATWCVNPEGLLARWERFEAKRDKEVDAYATADEYADDYWYDFAEEIYYEEMEHDGWDWETCCELGYMEACDHWYDNQPKPRPDV